MDDFILFAILGVFFVLIVGLFIYFYNVAATTNHFVIELSHLVSRTFREYYAGQDIEPVVVNNGIDLVWSGEVEGLPKDNKMGFIQAFTGAVSGTFADQWIDIIVPADAPGTAGVIPAVKKETNAGRGSNTKGSEGIITNGSKIIS